MATISPATVARLPPLLLAMLIAALAGCIAVPIPLGEGHVSAGREIAVEAEARLAVGATTRAEALARLGAPSATWDEQGVLVYDWDRVRWVLIWAVGGAGRGAIGMLDLPEHHMLLLQSDRGDILRRVDHGQRPAGTGYGDFLRRWVTPADAGQETK